MGGQTPPTPKSVTPHVARPSLSAALFLVAALVFIGALTLVPTPGADGSAGFCVFCGSLGGVDFTLNVLLFAPLGVAIWNVTGNWRHAVFAGLLVSMVVEALQFRLIVGRDATVGDVVANTLGACAGAWIATGIARLLVATATTVRRMAATAAVVTSMFAVVSTLLLLPRPTRYPQWVQWAPEKRNHEPFRGRLESVEFVGQRLSPGESIRPYRTMNFETHSHELKARIRGPVPTVRQAIIVRIANPWEEGFQLTQHGDGVAFRGYSFAERVRLRPLEVGLPHVLQRSTADSAIMIEAQNRPDRIVLSAGRTGGDLTSVTVRRTVGLAWTLWLPWNAAIGPSWWIANLCLLGGLLFPVSFLTARAVRLARVEDSPIGWWPIATIVATLAIMAPVTGMSQLRFAEWIGISAGILMGIVVDRSSASRRHPDGDRGGSLIRVTPASVVTAAGTTCAACPFQLQWAPSSTTRAQ